MIRGATVARELYSTVCPGKLSHPSWGPATAAARSAASLWGYVWLNTIEIPVPSWWIQSGNLCFVKQQTLHKSLANWCSQTSATWRSPSTTGKRKCSRPLWQLPVCSSTTNTRPLSSEPIIISASPPPTVCLTTNRYAVASKGCFVPFTEGNSPQNVELSCPKQTPVNS